VCASDSTLGEKIQKMIDVAKGEEAMLAPEELLKHLRKIVRPDDDEWTMPISSKRQRSIQVDTEARSGKRHRTEADNFTIESHGIPSSITSDRDQSRSPSIAGSDDVMATSFSRVTEIMEILLAQKEILDEKFGLWIKIIKTTVCYHKIMLTPGRQDGGPVVKMTSNLRFGNSAVGLENLYYKVA